VYYKICKNYFPILLYITKFAKIFPNTTLYYTICTNYFPILYTIKACIKHFPILLCTTKLAQFFSQYYRVLESLYKALPSTTLYYKVQSTILICLKNFEKERFCNFPDATGKSETRNETRGRSKIRTSYEISLISPFSTHYQTGWDVTKCYACHTNRYDNLLGKFRKGEILQFPPQIN